MKNVSSFFLFGLYYSVAQTVTTTVDKNNKNWRSSRFNYST